MGRSWSYLLVVSLIVSVFAGSVSTASVCAVSSNQNRTNWAGNLVYGARCLQEPSSVTSIIALVRKDTSVTALGKRHCFNSIADNGKNQISLVSSMHAVIALDTMAKTVTVEAGITYTQLCIWLDKKGYALHNLASLTDISVAGAISTATHGSGGRHGNLATAVAALEIVTASGHVRKLARGQRDFNGAVVGLGGLGVISRITLDVQPSYSMRQFVYLNASLPMVLENFETVMSSGYSVSLFTDWQNRQIKQLWVKVRDEPFTGPKSFMGGTLATENVHPLGTNAQNVTQQLGIRGPWYERLPHFQPGTIPSAGNELQSEYFLPREHALAAIQAMVQLNDQITPHLLISEIRLIAADSLWMSMAFGRASVALHFTWKKDWPAVQALMPVIEQALAPFHPHPHWGKLFSVAPSELHSRYKKVKAFRNLAAKHDPTGKFRNQFLNTNIFTD